MLILWCSVYENNRIKLQKKTVSEQSDLNDAFIECLNDACKTFDISMPLWHTKHTKQLSQFRKIVFLKDDFIDKMPYDRFVVEVLEND